MNVLNLEDRKYVSLFHNFLLKHSNDFITQVFFQQN